MGLRIVMLTTGYPRFEGDLFGFFVAELAKTLVAGGDEVRVLAPADPDAPSEEEQAGVRIRRVGYAWPAGWQRLAYGGGLVPNLRRRPYLGGLLPSFLACLARAVADEARQADLIHGQWLVSGLLGKWTRFSHRRPVVTTIRGSDLALLSGLPQGLAGWLLTGFQGLTAVSQEIQGRLREMAPNLGDSPEKVAFTPNGINTDLFTPRSQAACRADLGLEGDRPCLLWAGRLAPEKGLDHLIHAMPAILAQTPRTSLVLLGDGPLRGELTGLIRKLGLEESVELRPAIPRPRLNLWYGAADLVVLPSLREGRPNTVLEALACGRPVLASRVGGVGELIEDGLQGCLVPAGQPEVLGRTAAELLAQPQRLARMGQSGPARLESLGLTWAQSASRVREVYERAVEAWRGD